jgi:hypothetical protein
METVTISARINEKKIVEFYQTMESLKTLVKNYCNEFELDVSLDNNLTIKIDFNSMDELKSNFNNNEFNILKGSVRSLCDHLSVKINDVNTN